MTAGTILLTQVHEHTGTWVLLVAYLFFGIGFGMVNAPITNTAVSGMPISQAGVAAAVASTSRQVGSALGVAVVGSVYTSTLDDGKLAAAHAGWWIVAGCTLAVLVLGLVSSGRWAQASAGRMAERLSAAEAIDSAARSGGTDPEPRVRLSAEQ
jgi:MFS family permease